jgi:DNA-binding XRE family transcriptional regulator
MCLGYSQPAFGKLVGCSGTAIQQIENGILQLSWKLANSISEATGADPISLRAGRDARAMDMAGHEYTKESFQLLSKVIPCTEKELALFRNKLVQYLDLLLLSSNRSNSVKSYAVNAALQDAFQSIADDFKLEETIHTLLKEHGHVEKKIYRVCDLRRFPKYARILGFKDNKRFKPDKTITFTLTRGWMRHYMVYERPVLPHGADRKLRDAEYILDDERPMPKVIKEALAEALYWQILEFREVPPH